MEKNYYQIDENLAHRAKQSFSFTDYVPNSATHSYRNEVDYAWKLVEERKAKGDLSSAEIEKLEDFADRFARRYAKWINSHNANTASCPSVMISGAGNFPVRKKEKQNAREDKLFAEYNDIRKYLKWIEDFTVGRVSTAIMSGDSDAMEQLETKLQRLITKQEEMKAANVYYRKNGTMKGYGGMTEEQAEKTDEAIKNAYSWARQPYAAYLLSNNNGAIKQTRDRLTQLKREKATEGRIYDTEGLNLRIEENKEIMRLQVFFEGKPDEGTRTLLKSHAFKWAPSAGCWQRQLTNNARYDLKNIIKTLKETGNNGK